MEAWGEEIFPEGVGVKGKNGPGGGGGEGKIRLPVGFCSFAKPVHQMDGGSDWCGRLQID